ncbi:MAG: hypothetical protein GX902_09595 [Lentisphaerae bacterium]|jgi:hypothetical protein|nr:hypothetical protein [Lentisphaerota bacterium]
MATSTFRNKNMVRPKKTGAAKRRRCLVQRRRLVALGLSEEEVAKLQVHEVRAMLRRPAVVVAAVAKAAAASQEA